MSLNVKDIRVIMLDVDNTLLDFNRCAVLSAKAAGEVFGFEVPDTLFQIMTLHPAVTGVPEVRHFPVQFLKLNLSS